MTPHQHPAWPRLTNDQRKAVNEVWDDIVVPALEGADQANAVRDTARLEAQDARAQRDYLRAEIARLRWTTRRGA